VSELLTLTFALAEHFVGKTSVAVQQFNSRLPFDLARCLPFLLLGFLEGFEPFHFADLFFVLVVLLLAVVVLAVLCFLFRLWAAAFGAYVGDGEVDEPSETEGEGDGDDGYTKGADVVAVGGAQNIETEDDEADHVEGEGGFHEDGDVVGDLIVEGLVEVDADHYEEGEHKQQCDGSDGFVRGDAESKCEDDPPDESERNVHESNFAFGPLEISKKS
jgi:hypothetical protein